MSSDFDKRFMALALTLGRRGLGNAWPNPAVGAVVVKDGIVVGRGWTQPGGRPHAEVEALGRAGEAARGATLYATLEPCSHHGKTPPCVDAIMAAGIVRVVSALEDPNPKIAGQGHARLRAQGVTVDVGLGADEYADAGRLGSFPGLGGFRGLGGLAGRVRGVRGVRAHAPSPLPQVHHATGASTRAATSSPAQARQALRTANTQITAPA